MKTLTVKKARILDGSAMLEAVEKKAHSSAFFHSVKYVVVYEIMGKNRRKVGVFSSNPEQHKDSDNAKDLFFFGVTYPELADRMTNESPYLPAFNHFN